MGHTCSGSADHFGSCAPLGGSPAFFLIIRLFLEDARGGCDEPKCRGGDYFVFSLALVCKVTKRDAGLKGRRNSFMWKTIDKDSDLERRQW